jgi:hypothetical protein
MASAARHDMVVAIQSHWHAYPSGSAPAFALIGRMRDAQAFASAARQAFSPDFNERNLTRGQRVVFAIL